MDEHSVWLGDFLGNVSDASSSKISFFHLERNSPLRVGDYICAEHAGLGAVGRVHRVVFDRSSGEIIGEATLFSSIDVESRQVHSGVIHAPSVGDRVFTGSDNLVRAVAELGNRSDDAVTLNLCRLFGHPIQLAFTPERIFGRHCAIVGTTGGGKSWSVARLIEECSKYQGKVILFDPSGEYETLRQGVTHLHLGVGDAPSHSTSVSLPYIELTESDLFTILQPSGEAQAPKLRAAIRSLKLAKLEPLLSPGGVIIKAHRPKVDFEQAYAKHLKIVDGPGAVFDIRKLARQIQNECVNPQSSPVEPNVWGGPNGVDLSLCATLVSRIEDIVQNPSLTPLFKPAKDQPSLFYEIDLFLKDPRKRVLCVSLEHLSFAYGVRETVMNALGRRLLDRARAGMMREKPALVIVDEAHQFINAKTTDEQTNFSLNSFSLIAKEGRKYGLCVCLATQRPRDIPEAVLSQMGSIFIHRLTSERDVDLVERAAGNTSLSSIGSVATFAPGQAILIGADFPVPLLVSVNPPDSKPISRSSDFQGYWRGSSRAIIRE